MQALVKEYDEKYLPKADRFKCTDIFDISEMAKEAIKEKPHCSISYFLICFALEAGFMRGYRSACYDMKKGNR